MPELPEVETILTELQSSDIVGKKINAVRVFWPRTIATHAVEDFCQQIVHQTIQSISRRGKYLVFTLSTHTLLVHLRMTGKFTLSRPPLEPRAHERVQLELNDGRFLRYEDQRKFGKWDLVVDPTEKLASLGLEPLSKAFTLTALKDLLQSHATQIKPFLLNQKYIAGLGNIYVDEALWEAKIHPKRAAQSLSFQEIKALHTAIPKVLHGGIAHMGTSLGSKNANYFSVSGRRGGNQHQLNVFRRDGLLCPRCQAPIQKITLAQRGTHFCLHCQK